ncbi:GAF and ANTAR domain-containing protein [Blastococcus haudaquaticus]|uniref:GAF domain-containing protein n=1 Tax=Blastococcus haudaquaticus TaxID=1938745 RepID=A0A286GQJ6_9ACTN|nr:GAF and ANTAR domain-containing protein [Blastococcus haudaquaticus]SOD97790.1 GAF domain-containing protein [Blastococcus haudaquaticus]
MTAAQEDRQDRSDAPPRLGDVMSSVARHLQAEHGDVEETLRAITAAAVRTVPHTDECGVSYVVGRRTIESRAATSDLPRTLDASQQERGEGPCLDAAWDHEVVRVDDLPNEDRWPQFARRAADLGVGSMLCFQLFVAGDQLGALNLYSRTRGAFDDDSVDIGLVFASHAAVALAGAEHEAHLRTGMQNRDVIGQAKGILMERHRLTADQAFGVLARVSQELNRKLLDIARELTDTGSVPESRHRRD